MALKFHDRERLLPPGFINDDNGFSVNRDITKKEVGSFGSSFSDFISPFGSELSSTETESEEDCDNEFIDELARKMADYMLEEDDEETLNGPTEHHSEIIQSTSRRRPTSVPAHTFPAFSDNQPRHGAAIPPTHSQGNFPCPIKLTFNNLDTQPFVEHRGSACWGRQPEGTDLTQQLEEKHQFQHEKSHMPHNRGKRADAVGCVGGSLSPETEGLPLLQGRQLHKLSLVGSDSGTRAVFPAQPGSKRGSTGTGVFLPAGISKPTKKKSVSSTVLVPARVIQVLQLHFEDMKKNTRSQSMGFTSHPSQQKVGNDSDVAVEHHETVLPQEWTY